MLIQKESYIKSPYMASIMLSLKPLSKKRTVIKLGGSVAVTIPSFIGLSEGDKLEVYLDPYDMSFLLRKVVR